MVSATGNIGKEKSRNLTNFLRIKKGLKKKAFEFSALVGGVDACMIIYDPKQHRHGTDHRPETYHSSSEQDDDDAWSAVEERALIQSLKTLIPKGKDAILTHQRRWEQVATAIPGKKTANQCKKKFALLMKGGFSFNSETE